jgi:hypothetical protein
VKGWELAEKGRRAGFKAGRWRIPVWFQHRRACRLSEGVATLAGWIVYFMNAYSSLQYCLDMRWSSRPLLSPSPVLQPTESTATINTIMCRFEYEG